MRGGERGMNADAGVGESGNEQVLCFLHGGQILLQYVSH